MESMGIPNSPSSGLELTIATPAAPAPAPTDGFRISSSSASGEGNIDGSNIQNKRWWMRSMPSFNKDREQAVVDDAQHHAIVTTAAGVENRPPPVAVGGSSSRAPHPYNRLSTEQFATLEATFQENHSPDQEAMLALAQTLNLTLKKVQVWFVNRRSRLKKREMVEKEKELETYKRQVESLTEQTHHLQDKVKKLKKKVRKLKLKQKQAPSMAPPPPPPAAGEEQQQQQRQQVMYVPILAGLFTNGEQNGATTAATASILTHQGSGGTTAVPITNALLLPSPGPAVQAAAPTSDDLGGR